MSEFSFALIADPQYATREPLGDRYYRNSPDKIKKCAKIWRGAGVDFAVCLGDVINGEPTREMSLQAALYMQEVLISSGVPIYHVLGNHDVASVSREILYSNWNVPSPGYYAFEHKGVAFLVLDTNFDENGDRFKDWKESYINEPQLLWLLRALSEISAPVIVFSHSLLDDAPEDPHVLRNAGEVRRILEESGKVLGVFQGHKHSGDFSKTNGIPYFTLKGLVDMEYAFSTYVVTVKGDELFVEEHTESGGPFALEI